MRARDESSDSSGGRERNKIGKDTARQMGGGTSQEIFQYVMPYSYLPFFFGPYSQGSGRCLHE